ncbi:integrase catalytic domain-containing protein [Trichonephila clavipes]|uniref:Integrase catalytic domain-containing protein n=1 Tax=Trichonephila clavipes TaxID=2585209 RepID=A0A8X6SIZ5_TRICX|nr:integrase catalytic domain-containing protein [Trichonephila clavipes]
MAKGGFDLREWEWSGDCEHVSKNETQELGLIWNKELDTLRINMKWLDDINMDKITKRSMLSTVHTVFDPIGFISPVMLCPKIILQKAWKLGTSWDEELTGELPKEFVQWFQELKYLSDIQIPRYIQMSHEASTAKSQGAPLRGATIPRMELPAAVIGHDWNEEEIGKERSKASYVLTNNEAGGVENWYYRYFSNYDRIIHLVAQILRFMHKCKNVTGKKHGELTVTEFQEAETRYTSKNLKVISPPLPENRVKDAAVFQITGVDMAGPLFLKENNKSWVLIFTCAVYRAVHFEFATAASTDVFLMAFRRFVARRGRSTTVYCDNGTNFIGAANYFKQLNWSRIQKDGAINSIEWKFTPPPQLLLGGADGGRD